MILIPFYLENILRFDMIHVGLLMGIVPVMLGIISPFSGALSDRAGTRPITIAGLAVLLIGYLIASTLSSHTSVFGYLIRMFAIGLGMGVFISPNNSAIMGVAARNKLGIVSGFMAITRTLGQTVGVALMGAIWASRTLSYAGEAIGGGVTSAPVSAQIEALHDTFHFAAALLVLSLLLGIWAYSHEGREKRKHA
jgi:MFS family permease